MGINSSNLTSVNKPSNSRMIDKLATRDKNGNVYILSPKVECAFRAVDRGLYYTRGDDDEDFDIYSDGPWKNGNLHMSAPCIYARVVEALDLKPGLSFLNLGSGTGYLSTIVGLLIGPNGLNRGIEYHADVVKYANDKLQEFYKKSYAVDRFDFSEPYFMTGSMLHLDPLTQYDRVYLGAECLPYFQNWVKGLVKPGGILVMPYNGELIRCHRINKLTTIDDKLMSVRFTDMIDFDAVDQEYDIIRMPVLPVKSLKEICRAWVRRQARDKLEKMHPNLLNSGSIIERRKRHERMLARASNQEALYLAKGLKLRKKCQCSALSEHSDYFKKTKRRALVSEVDQPPSTSQLQSSHDASRVMTRSASRLLGQNECSASNALSSTSSSGYARDDTKRSTVDHGATSGIGGSSRDAQSSDKHNNSGLGGHSTAHSDRKRPRSESSDDSESDNDIVASRCNSKSSCARVRPICREQILASRRFVKGLERLAQTLSIADTDEGLSNDCLEQLRRYRRSSEARLDFASDANDDAFGDNDYVCLGRIVNLRRSTVVRQAAALRSSCSRFATARRVTEYHHAPSRAPETGEACGSAAAAEVPSTGPSLLDRVLRRRQKRRQLLSGAKRKHNQVSSSSDDNEPNDRLTSASSSSRPSRARGVATQTVSTDIASRPPPNAAASISPPLAAKSGNAKRKHEQQEDESRAANLGDRDEEEAELNYNRVDEEGDDNEAGGGYNTRERTSAPRGISRRSSHYVRPLDVLARRICGYDRHYSWNRPFFQRVHSDRLREPQLNPGLSMVSLVEDALRDGSTNHAAMNEAMLDALSDRRTGPTWSGSQRGADSMSAQQSAQSSEPPKKKARSDECEQYHRHMKDYIKGLPVPHILHNYLNYERA